MKDTPREQPQGGGNTRHIVDPGCHFAVKAEKVEADSPRGWPKPNHQRIHLDDIAAQGSRVATSRVLSSLRPPAHHRGCQSGGTASALTGAGTASARRELAPQQLTGSWHRTQHKAPSQTPTNSTPYTPT